MSAYSLHVCNLDEKNVNSFKSLVNKEIPKNNVKLKTLNIHLETSKTNDIELNTSKYESIGLFIDE